MIRFGTGGWRAVIGDTFIRSNIRRVAAAVARRMHREGVAQEGFCIGYDRRFLSRESAIWFSEVMAAEGVRLYFVNLAASSSSGRAASSSLVSGPLMRTSQSDGLKNFSFKSLPPFLYAIIRLVSFFMPIL